MSHRPVLQPSQCRLGFRWRGQIADEDDLLNRKHPDDEHDAGADLQPIAAPEATMIASTNRAASNGGAIARPITNETHKDPFSHALRARLSSRRIADPPSVAVSCAGPSSREIAGGVFDSSTSVDVLPPGVCSRVRHGGGPADAPRSALPSARRSIARAHPCRFQSAGRWGSWPGWPNSSQKKQTLV